VRHDPHRYITDGQFAAESDMRSTSPTMTPMRHTYALRVFTWAVLIGMSLLVSSCVVQPRYSPPPRGPVDPGPGPRPGPGPATGCAPGSFPIGVLAVSRNTVFRNGMPAGNGERVCNGDHISTNATGTGDLLLDGDHASDTIHFAAGTDPSITVTPNGCVNVDAYRRGRIVVTARRRCIVLRTPDTLLLLSNGSVQLDVIPNQSTGVFPLRGSLIKLRNISLNQTARLPAAELSRYAAPRDLQPVPRTTNVYRNFIRAQPVLPPGGGLVPRRPATPNPPSDVQIR